MSKNIINYVCEECGYSSRKWMGRCPQCQAWNSFQEELIRNDRGNNNITINNEPLPISRVESGEEIRYKTGIQELDRVLGGGIVSGSLILLGGAPGIGKSTLVLQVASLFSKKYNKVLYVSGEESAAQIKIRAGRINALNDNLFVLAETYFDQILAHINKEKYSLVIIDSIQTISDPDLNSSPGSVSQIKEITNSLMKVAKSKGVPIILVGHVTKEGELAGPRVLEHLVDAVLQFEGDRSYSYRILRAIKNRFGSTNEVGVFEMRNTGMEEVLNPSLLFLEERPRDVSGSVIVPVMEGSRPILVEVQALVSSATFSVPQRAATGVDYKRVMMLLAVLEKKLGIVFQNKDVHINITGGFRINEPALDMGVVTAIISSHGDLPIPDNMAVVGEIGLAGEVRAVSNISQRISELKKIGFEKIVLPQGNLKGLETEKEIRLLAISNIHDLFKIVSEVG
ncbi:MAG TPA: DNA repair protein RadA [Halanaerobiaceae bacterium]|jgi:DNA repair protein RadA/Sms|nr:DNA repair protein RadA [Bacillota bacterium]HHU92244.1 DNA repair protein RadA [Halanaerobiaceae bacterium]HOA40455.1 DNA repair protein RadA [Halanaerobiales bacterium]HPZ62702.1 DNA repair protein RadA [Halanaerobiales bacterium]HQD03468.1 DNA repair protein RadA [Halanaerobiales bacterium]